MSKLQLNSKTSRNRRIREARLEFLEPRHMLAAAGGWTATSPGGGGALFAPAINPHDPAEMYVYSDMSQVMRTRDAGASWYTLDFEQLGGSSGQPQVQFTSDRNVQYAIDFAAIDQLDAAVPVRSDDGGNTWQHLTDPTERETFYLFADYDNSDRLIVSDWTNFYISHDGGQTFTRKYTVPEGGNGSGLHLGGVFFDGFEIYVGTNHGLLVSSDNGDSFQMNELTGFATGEDLVTLTGAKENGQVRLYAVSQATEVWGGYQAADWWDFSNVYRMDVGQQDWYSVKSDLPTDAKPYFVDMAANEVDTVYLAGSDEGGMPLIYKSEDGGLSWTDVFRWKNNENIATGWQGEDGQIYWWWGGAAIGFDVDRSNSDNVLATDLGFAHWTDNGGETWRNVNVHPEDLNPVGEPTSRSKPYRSSGLGNTAIWDLAWLDEDTILAGFSDIEAAISNDGGRSWSFDYSGLGQNSLYRAQVHPDTGIVYGVTSTVHDVYEVTRVTDGLLDSGDGKVVFSEDQGSTWQTMHDFGKVVRWMELDPHTPNRMYVSVVHSTQGGIYVSNNIDQGSGATWQKLDDPPRTEGHPFEIKVLDDGTLLATYSARRTGDNGPFTASSGVFISADGGQTWLDRSDPRMLYWTQHITVDPHDPTQSTWYAGVYSGWGGPANDLGGLYRTTNRGTTWEFLYGSHRVSSATVSPTNAEELYLTTESEGLIYSGNLSDPTPTFARVAGMNFATPKRVIYNPYDPTEVWVTTFGGQLWIGSTETRPDAVTAGDFNADGQVAFDDFLILSANFGTNVEPRTSGDADGNGRVEFADFLVLSKNFGKRVR